MNISGWHHNSGNSKAHLMSPSRILIPCFQFIVSNRCTVKPVTSTPVTGNILSYPTFFSGTDPFSLLIICNQSCDGQHPVQRDEQQLFSEQISSEQQQCVACGVSG